MRKKEYLRKLDELNLDKNEYCIISGGAMIMNNLREETNDIDLQISHKLFEELSKKYILSKSAKFENLYEFSDEIEMKVDKIDPKEIVWIEGYPVINIEKELEWKLMHKRTKDEKDIERIKKYLNNKK